MKRPDRSTNKRQRLNTEIGWRELIALPELGIDEMRAKIDTGARTSALHARDIQVIERPSGHWVNFQVSIPESHRQKRCEARLVDQREIRNTSGISERRYVIKTILCLGDRHWQIELSLADRKNMGFELILGRTALRTHQLLVNPSRSYLRGKPNPKKAIHSDSPSLKKPRKSTGER